MASEPKSTNLQYYMGAADQFPNKSHRYMALEINGGKARRDQRQSRKIEALTGRERILRAKMEAKDPKERKKYRRTVNNVLKHFYDQSLLASEHSQFPSLPKESVLDMDVPAKGLTIKSKVKRRRRPTGQLKTKLFNSFVPTNFSKGVDSQITTPSLLISGREQPYGGSEGTPEIYQVPTFVPNAAYGGTQVRYY